MMMNIETLNKIKTQALPQLFARLESMPDKYVIENDKPKLAGEYFEKQTRIALKNFDIINPAEVDEYIALGGYFPLAKVLETEKREIIDTMIESNLRGRGGAGFPTGKKWETAFGTESDQKYVGAVVPSKIPRMIWNISRSCASPALPAGSPVIFSTDMPEIGRAHV